MNQSLLFTILKEKTNQFETIILCGSDDVIGRNDLIGNVSDRGNIT